MIETLREWLLSLVTVSMLLSVTQILIPEGNLRKIGTFTSGLVLLLVLVTPVLKIDFKKLELDWETYQEAMERQQEHLAEAGESKLAELIETRTAAYISDKAASLGLDISVRVDTETGKDGIPVPTRVELTGEPSDLLSDWLETEMGIPKERQVWHEREN